MTLEPGVISEGTLRNEDLILAFLDALEDVDRAEADSLRKEIWTNEEGDIEENFWDSEDAAILYVDLTNALNDHCPAYCWFGAHEGDGTCFGVWVDVEQAGQAVRDEDILGVSDLSEVPNNYMGEVLEVNDHGNTTLWQVDGKDFKEIWAVV